MESAFFDDYFGQVEQAIRSECERKRRRLDDHYTKLLDEVGACKRAFFERIRSLPSSSSGPPLDEKFGARMRQYVEYRRQYATDTLQNPTTTDTQSCSPSNERDMQVERSRVALERRIASAERRYLEQFIGNESVRFRPCTDEIELERHCGSVERASSIDSLILTPHGKRDLCELCRFVSPHNAFTLLYRATRDGFSAAAFHDKCDHKERTLVVIKATSGCIFGGYSRLAWDDQSNTFKPDKATFVFSLAKASEERVVSIRAKLSAKSMLGIFCQRSLGPTFAISNSNSNSIEHIMRVDSESNVNATSVCNFGATQTYDISDFDLVKDLYTFVSAEIEVFQVD